MPTMTQMDNIMIGRVVDMSRHITDRKLVKVLDCFVHEGHYDLLILHPNGELAVEPMWYFHLDVDPIEELEALHKFSTIKVSGATRARVLAEHMNP